VGGSKAKHAAPPPKEKEVPEELKCPICKVPMRDAVVIPCCNKSFCDECKLSLSHSLSLSLDDGLLVASAASSQPGISAGIREHLLEKDFTCPLCEAEDVSPDSLKPNKQLREVGFN
jgi:rubredoxin